MLLVVYTGAQPDASNDEPRLVVLLAVHVEHVAEVIEGDAPVAVDVGRLDEHVHVVLAHLPVAHVAHDLLEHRRVDEARVVRVVHAERLLDGVEIGDGVVLQQRPERVDGEVGLADEEAVLLVRHVRVKCAQLRLEVLRPQHARLPGVEEGKRLLHLLARDAHAVARRPDRAVLLARHRLVRHGAAPCLCHAREDDSRDRVDSRGAEVGKSSVRWQARNDDGQ
mmetsp:Transcript_45803/g.141120  ORF Transcript_45803/g.141120 Transcript_45803/m.141120 type:complete len:223 (-) Transcript_45803:22-690(-)